jgi:hypothetical protein
LRIKNVELETTRLIVNSSFFIAGGHGYQKHLFLTYNYATITSAHWGADPSSLTDFRGLFTKSNDAVQNRQGIHTGLWFDLVQLGWGDPAQESISANLDYSVYIL